MQNIMEVIISPSKNKDEKIVAEVNGKTNTFWR